ncbi:MAG TPA: hypothetical protein VM597_23535, partial [Gemmataceae bacterium]|nr:hypothetical protein [Gemmataceae bacterium]
GDPGSMLYSYRRLKVYKKAGMGGANQFRVRLMPTSPLAQVRFPPQDAPGQARMSPVEGSAPGRKECRWEASFDLGKVPAGEYVDVVVETLAPGQFLRRGESSTTYSFDIQAETAEVTRWLLMPRGKAYRDFHLIRYRTGKPDQVEPVQIVTKYLAEDSAILAYKLLSVDGGYTYEVTWQYK